VPLLFGSLALLVGLCGAAGTFGLGFLLARLALGVGLVLLGLTFSVQVVAARHLSDDLLGLAFHTLDGAFDGFLGSAVLSHSASSLFGRRTRVRRWIRGADGVHPQASRVAATLNAAATANPATSFQIAPLGNSMPMSISPTSSMPASTTSPAAVLFDIDGTLVDSNYLHVHAWQRAFSRMGFEVEAWRIHRGIGMGGSHLVSSLTGDPPEEAVEHLKELHAQYYGETLGLLRPLPGATALLDAVADRGLQVALATSAPENELSTLRKVLGRDDIVSAVTSSADVDTAKPQPDIVEVAMQRTGVTAPRAVFVGDTIWDIRAARRAGVACLCVLSGGIARDELNAEGAAAVFDDPAQLLEDIHTTPIAALTTTAAR